MIVYLNYVVNKNEAERLSGASIAGNNMQLALNDILVSRFKDFISVVVYPVASFPKGKRIIYRKKRALVKTTETIRVGFINIPIIKQLTQIYSCYKETSKYINSKDDIVLTYNMYPQTGLPAVLLQKKYSCTIVAQVADLPIHNKEKKASVFERLFNCLTESLLRRCDKVIVLNKEAWRLYCPQAELIVMDGGIMDEDYYRIQETKKDWNGDRYNILYTGSLDRYSGILELIEAMSFIQNDLIELDVCGDGELRNELIKREKKDRRIHYYGKISNDNALRLQSSSWVLINPRPIDDPIAKVTFPSKIFEYLSSGRPVIATRLACFSDEYEGCMIFTDGNSPRDIANAINETYELGDEELKEMTDKALRLVEHHRLWSSRAEEIASFIETKRE